MIIEKTIKIPIKVLNNCPILPSSDRQGTQFFLETFEYLVPFTEEHSEHNFPLNGNAQVELSPPLLIKFMRDKQL